MIGHISNKLIFTNTVRKTAIKEIFMKVTALTLMRLAGLSAIPAGLSIINIGMFHPVKVLFGRSFR